MWLWFGCLFLQVELELFWRIVRRERIEGLFGELLFAEELLLAFFAGVLLGVKPFLQTLDQVRTDGRILLRGSGLRFWLRFFWLRWFNRRFDFRRWLRRLFRFRGLHFALMEQAAQGEADLPKSKQDLLFDVFEQRHGDIKKKKSKSTK